MFHLNAFLFEDTSKAFMGMVLTNEGSLVRIMKQRKESCWERIDTVSLEVKDWKWQFKSYLHTNKQQAGQWGEKKHAEWMRNIEQTDQSW